MSKERQRKEKAQAIVRRQEATHQRAVMRKKMSQVDQGIAQTHLERKVAKATTTKTK